MSLTGGYGHLVTALAAFLIAHSLTNVRSLREAAMAAFGKRGFYGGYSVLSSVLLVWVVAAAIHAPIVQLWPQLPWMRWAPSLAMPIACLLAVAGMTVPNPFSIGPGGKSFDPKRPGILRLTRHPMIWALGLWSGAHLIPNGTVAGVLLFLPLFILCLLGPRILDAKRRRQLGEEVWQGLAMPLSGSLDWRALAMELGPWRLMAGLALPPILMALHPLVIGLSPYP
ncbi:hypothetical protein CU669_06020 [Paramagnetospirillum kuznetsovii]|uniref:NnrU domain-containing protein n=1 Tax=Paramagnetospirillum kuznetsovii TaxID=2053833 RepID=A0A364P0V8_9PROT|nr:NnrU family protein [Paramagnetospirillum kuznetsovii]RAU22936.1 hypothetical protein CU669_06020 [Paramagnetospirillum kuznetsovii]